MGYSCLLALESKHLKKNKKQLDDRNMPLDFLIIWPFARSRYDNISCGSRTLLWDFTCSCWKARRNRSNVATVSSPLWHCKLNLLEAGMHKTCKWYRIVRTSLGAKSFCGLDSFAVYKNRCNGLGRGRSDIKGVMFRPLAASRIQTEWGFLSHLPWSEILRMGMLAWMLWQASAILHSWVTALKVEISGRH